MSSAPNPSSADMVPPADAENADGKGARIGFILPFALANAGAYVAFLPLLAILVPLKAGAIDPVNKVALLSTALAVGTAIASLANILAGILSDRQFRARGSRWAGMAIGLVGTLLSYAGLYAADTAVGLVAALGFFQISFNMMFAPLTALLPDEIPDRQKGLVSALMNLGMPIASLASGLISLPLMTGSGRRFAAVALLIGLSQLPLLTVYRRRGPVRVRPSIAHEPVAIHRRWRDFAGLWISRFFVQAAHAVIVGYLLFYLQDRVRYAAHFPGQTAEYGLAKMTVLATFATVAISPLVGGWSDRSERRKPFLYGAIGLMVAGSLILALRPEWPQPMIGYLLFAIGSAVYLTVDFAMIAQRLPSAAHRGRDLGIMNLANTLPAFSAPFIALLALGRSNDYRALMLTTAAMVLAGGVCLSWVRSRPLVREDRLSV